VAQSRLVHLISIRLGSSLSPNGLQISIAKCGGYDLYSLDSGIVLHTYEHGLTPDTDKYPTTFLPRGFVFCGATADGTVTLWDVKQGGRLQSVQHLRASILFIFLYFDSHLPQAGVTIHALAVCSTVSPLLSWGGLTSLLTGLRCREFWYCAPRNSISR
jgi:WD40 repeat protein